MSTDAPLPPPRSTAVTPPGGAAASSLPRLFPTQKATWSSCNSNQWLHDPETKSYSVGLASRPRGGGALHPSLLLSHGAGGGDRPPAAPPAGLCAPPPRRLRSHSQHPGPAWPPSVASLLHILHRLCPLHFSSQPCHPDASVRGPSFILHGRSSRNNEGGTGLGFR